MSYGSGGVIQNHLVEKNEKKKTYQGLNNASEHVVQAMDRLKEEGEGGGWWWVFLIVVLLCVMLVAEVN